jgi:hypothetical protein
MSTAVRIRWGMRTGELSFTTRVLGCEKAALAAMARREQGTVMEKEAV